VEIFPLFLPPLLGDSPGGLTAWQGGHCSARAWVPEVPGRGGVFLQYTVSGAPGCVGCHSQCTLHVGPHGGSGGARLAHADVALVKQRGADVSAFSATYQIWDPGMYRVTLYAPCLNLDYRGRNRDTLRNNRAVASWNLSVATWSESSAGSGGGDTAEVTMGGSGGVDMTPCAYTMQGRWLLWGWKKVPVDALSLCPCDPPGAGRAPAAGQAARHPGGEHCGGFRTCASWRSTCTTYFLPGMTTRSRGTLQCNAQPKMGDLHHACSPFSRPESHP